MSKCGSETGFDRIAVSGDIIVSFLLVIKEVIDGSLVLDSMIVAVGVKFQTI